MKILHTSDWHLGKKLEGRLRLAEQEEALNEIEQIAVNHAADVIVIAGDVFDTLSPSPQAEQLFYSAVLRLSRHAIVAAVAGNHDDPRRLEAPSGIAGHCGIILAGGANLKTVSIKNTIGKEYGVTIEKNGERLNLALVPFLADYAFAGGATYCENVLSKMNAAAADVFSNDGFNMLVTHLFFMGGETSDERELGSAKILPISVLPKCDYVALGHIHKPMKVSPNGFYSGSLLSYSFDETSDRCVRIVDTLTKQSFAVSLTSGKKLYTVHAESFDEAIEKIAAHKDGFVRLMLKAAIPLTLSQSKVFGETAHLLKICIEQTFLKSEIKKRSDKSGTELFKEFFCQFHEQAPPSELVREFEELLEENV